MKPAVLQILQDFPAGILEKPSDDQPGGTGLAADIQVAVLGDRQEHVDVMIPHIFPRVRSRIIRLRLASEIICRVGFTLAAGLCHAGFAPAVSDIGGVCRTVRGTCCRGCGSLCAGGFLCGLRRGNRLPCPRRPVRYRSGCRGLTALRLCGGVPGRSPADPYRVLAARRTEMRCNPHRRKTHGGDNRRGQDGAADSAVPASPGKFFFLASAEVFHPLGFMRPR